MPVETEKPRILFLCTGNACRSPMAEGLLELVAPSRYESVSAGSHPAGFVHPLAVEVMAELGVDISLHRSKSIKEFLPPVGVPPDVVVSLCDFAARRCPVIPATTGAVHWPVPDPIVAAGNREIQRSLFRGVRNELRLLIQSAFEGGTFENPPLDSDHPLRRRGLVRILERIGETLRQ